MTDPGIMSSLLAVMCTDGWQLIVRKKAAMKNWSADAELWSARKRHFSSSRTIKKWSLSEPSIIIKKVNWIVL